MRRVIRGIPRGIGICTCMLALLLLAGEASAFYGTVEYMDGRTLNGRIEVVNTFSVTSSLTNDLGFFEPGDNAYIMVPIADIKRIEFNWNYDPGSVQPYYLRNKGDIKIFKLNGELIQGGFFGSSPGVRELKVILDDFKQEPVFLNDTKLDKYSCIKSISFNTVNVPEDVGTTMNSAVTGTTSTITYRVSVDSADLSESPSGPSRAKIKYGVGLVALETKGEWMRVRTVGDIEVEGWIRTAWVTRSN